MVTMMQDLFARPQQVLAGRKVVILQLGTVHLLAPARWNNLAIMNRSQKLLAGRNNVATCVVRGEIAELEGRNKSRVPG